MVPPKLMRPRIGTEHIEDSNSTAKLFLGGARPNWMSDSKNAPVASSQPSQTVPALPTATTTADPLPQEDSVRSGPAEGALMSPVTPGSTLTPAGPVHISQPHANKPDRPVALPSPVPSTGSQPSPIVSHTRPAGLSEAAPQVSDHTAVAILPEQERDGRQYMTTTAAEGGPGQQSAGSTQPPHVAGDGDRVSCPETGRDSNQSPSVASAERPHSNTPTSTPIEGRPLQLSDSGGHGQSTGRISPTEDLWKQWKAKLEHLKQELRGSPSPIVTPRLMLLEDALEYRDPTYLLLHQIYCRHSVDGKIFNQLPSLLHKTYLRGVDTLTLLLENNAAMPASTVWSFAHFPSKLDDIWQEPWVRFQLQELPRFLHFLPQHLNAKDQFLATFYSRGYPPLVDELRVEFRLSSPVLLGVLSASFCRQLYDRDKLPALNKLLRKDLLITSRLLEAQHSGTPHKHQRLLQHMYKLIAAYIKIPMKARTGSPIAQPPLPAPLGRQVHPGYQSQTGAVRVHSSPSIGNLSITSPPVSAFTYNRPASNSPQWGFVQSPEYQHHSPFSPHQVQSIQQGSPSPTLHGQMGPPNAQTAFQRASSSNGQSPPSLQPISGRQPQPGGSGHTPHYAQPGQAQSHPAFAYATPPPTQPFPRPHWTTAQAPQQALIPPCNVPLVNPHFQQRASQTSAFHVPHNQAGGQQNMSLGGAASPDTHASQLQRPLVTPLLPPAGYHAPITVHPDPMRLGLHQADLRDPVKKLFKPGPTGGLTESELYHFQSDFLLTPQSIDPKMSCYNWNFDLPPDDYRRFPKLQDPGQRQRLVRIFQPGCRTFRLRSIKLSESEKDDLPRLWPIGSTTWPSVFYIHVNGVEMFPRRKVHNGKDFPVDITQHLKPGENKVTVHFLLGNDECKDFKYAFAIERMVTTSFEHVRRAVAVTTTETTREVIRKRLTPSVNDEDFSFITDNLTINLVDPFMAQIYNIPARSIYCNHLECFDLDTYIHTRRSLPGPTPFNDNWQCPICRADARPQCLRVDGFLTEVRNELICSRRLATHAIQVKADGTWSVKVPSDDSSSNPPLDRRSASSTSKRRADSVIEPETERRSKSPEKNAHARTHEPVVIEID